MKFSEFNVAVNTSQIDFIVGYKGLQNFRISPSDLVGIYSSLNFISDSGSGTIDLGTQAFSILGTANEIETSGANQTLTIGLPDNVTITGELTVSGTGQSSFGGQLTIPATPVAGTDAASKSYVDSQVTIQDLDFQGDSGTGAVDLDSQIFILSGTTNEIETSASGQTITIGLPNDVTIGNDLTVTSELTVSGAGQSSFTGQVTIPLTPTANTDAASKGYVDSQITAQDLDFQGDSGTGQVDLDSQIFTVAGTSNEIETSASNQTITIGLPDDVTVTGELTVSGTGQSSFGGQVTIPATPVANTDAASKGYVDGLVTAQDLDITDGTNNSSVDLDSQTLTFTQTANETTVTVSAQEVTIGLPNDVTISGTYTGTTFAGQLDGSISSATTATTQAPNDNSTKVATTAYVDTSAGNYLPLAGGTMSGNIAMGGNDISGGGTATFTTFVGALTGNASTASALAASGNITLTGDTTSTGGPYTYTSGGNVAIATTIADTTVTGKLLTGVNLSTSQNIAATDTILEAFGYLQAQITQLPQGLVYSGTWNANTNTPTLASGTGTTGHFYIVSVAGNTNLDGITDWQVGDWAIFIESGATDTWQKIDNTSAITGTGTTNAIAKWTGPSTLGTGLITDDGTTVTIGNSGDLDVTGDTDVTGDLAWGTSLTDTTNTISITKFVDEADGIPSNDNDTSIPTSAAVKDYVDTQIGTVDTLAEVLVGGNTTGGRDISVSAGDDILFSDSSRAKFGDSGSDLQIYHDGNNSFIRDDGTGDFFFTSNGNGFYFQSETGENLATFLKDTSGIEVTGDADVSGNVFVGGANSNFSENNLRFKSAGAAYIDHNTVGQSFIFRTSASSSLDTTAVTIDSSGNVGIGDSTPDSTLSLQNSQSTAANNTTTGSIFQALSPNSGIFMRNRGASAGIGGSNYSTQLFTDSGAGNFEIYNIASSADLVFGTNATERMRIDSSGDATFAGTIASGNISVTGGGGGNGQIDVLRTSGANVRIQSQSATGVLGVTTNHPLQLKTNDTTRLTISAGGDATFAGNVELASGTTLFGMDTIRLVNGSNARNLSCNGAGNLLISNAANSASIFHLQDGALTLGSSIGTGTLALYAGAATFAGAVTITQNSGSLQFSNTGSGHGSITTGLSKDLNIGAASGNVYINNNTTFAGNIQANGTFIELDSPSDALLIIDRASTSDVARLSWRNAGSEFFKAGIETSSNDLWSLLHTCGNGLYFNGATMTFGFGRSPETAITLPQGNSATNKISWYDGSNTFAASIYANSSTDNLTFATKNASNAETIALEIDTNQNVGIGITPYSTQKLAIACGTIDGAIYATSTDANCFASFRDGNSTANIEYGAVGNDHVLRKDGAHYFLVNGDGDVYNYQSSNKANTFYGYAAGDYSAAGGSNTFMGYNCANNLSSGAANVGIGRDVYITTLTGSNNTAVGYGACQVLTSGGNNVAVGKGAGASLTSGAVNTFVGDSAGNSATTVSSTTAVGFTALASLTTGIDNTAIGRAAATNLSTGGYVVAIGNYAADALTTNGVTIAIGFNALTTNTAGDNVAIGHSAGEDLTSGTLNTMLGNYAGRNATTSSYGTYLGRTAGQNHTTGAEPFYIGYDAGQQVTTGNYNTAIGTSAMTYGNGSSNTYVGWQCGFGVNGQDNSNNTAVGMQSLRSIQTGAQNTAMGRGALYHTTTGSYNVAIGWDAYQGVTNTQYNTGVGANTGVYQTGNYNTSMGYFSNYGVSGSSSGDYNAMFGYFAGAYNRGENNTFLGAIAGRFCSTGARNTVVGAQAMDNNTMTGNNNVAIGFTAGQDLTTQSDTTIIGSYAGANLTTGEGQVVIGNGAMQNSTTASGNIAVGKHALRNCTTGGSNIAIGYAAAEGGTVSGGANIVIGDAAGYNLSGGSNNILIGQNAGRSGSTSPSSLGSVTTNSNEIQMGNGSHTGAFIQVAWTVASDVRDKGKIKDLPYGLDFVNQLQPKSFEFKPDREAEETDGIERYGFLAQDVLELEGDNPVIVNNKNENKLKMTNDHIIPILVNAIKELKQEIEILKSK